MQSILYSLRTSDGIFNTILVTYEKDYDYDDVMYLSFGSHWISPCVKVIIEEKLHEAQVSDVIYNKQCNEENDFQRGDNGTKCLLNFALFFTFEQFNVRQINISDNAHIMIGNNEINL